MDRFTAYLDDDELDAIHALARQWDTSDNYILRIAIRTYLHLDCNITPRILSGPPRPVVTRKSRT